MPTTTAGKKLINVLVIDDHKMIRDGLKVMLASLHKSQLFKVTEADSGEDGISKLNGNQFDIVLMDYQLPGMSGAETIHRMLRFRPRTKILALSNYVELSYIQSMMDAGASGYILKNIEPAEMLLAIKTVLSRKHYYCSEVAVKLIEAEEEKEKSKRGIRKILTSRELEVLQMIAMEMNNDEIADKLFVAKRTVDSHRQNLLNKLDVKNTAGLVKIALKLELIK